MHIIVTTARHTNQRVRSLAKELAAALFSAVRINRGKLSLEELVALARDKGARRVLIVGRGLRGNPGRIVILDTTFETVMFYPLIIALSGIKLAREQGVKPTPPPAPTPIVPSPAQGENAEFAQELAAALDLPYIEVDDLREIATLYPRAIVVEWVGSKRTKHVVKFVSCSDRSAEGPKLFVKRPVYRRLTYEEVVGAVDTQDKAR